MKHFFRCSVLTVLLPMVLGVCTVYADRTITWTPASYSVPAAGGGGNTVEICDPGVEWRASRRRSDGLL